VRYIRLGYYQSAGCPASSCGSTTLAIGEVEAYDVLGTDYVVPGITTSADSSIPSHGPSLVADGEQQTW
jgi:hypothetical protein